MSSRVLYGARGGAEAIGEVRASSPASGQRPPARLACIAFTERGLAVARRVELALSCPSPADAGTAWEVSVECGFGEGKIDLAAFADRAWAGSDALLFVGAAGIAVRAIAPHVRSKATDPAVVVLDEGARFSVALLSGHIGGANELARQVARAVGAEPVVTTATDGRGLWAVDEWAARSGLLIANPHAIKAVSGRMLSGCEVSLFSDTPISGKPPRHVAITPYADEADVVISPFYLREHTSAGDVCDTCAGESDAGCGLPLRLVPRCIVLGVGCRRDTRKEAIERAFARALEAARIVPEAVAAVSTIDVKANEVGLLAFCRARRLPLATYSAAELSQVAGSVSSSDFVRATVGVDNVCERASLVGGGRLVFPKLALDGVTIAFTQVPLELSFEER